MSVIDGRVVIDASVAVKWYVPEPGSIAAAGLLSAPIVRMAPDLLTAEVGNTLRKKTERGELRRGDALAITIHLRCPVCDGLYIGLAVAEACHVITADDRLVRLTRGTALEPFVRRLEESYRGDS